MSVMDGDMLARLGQLQAKVAQFGALASRLAAALPQQAEGSDSSGRVQVILAGDGVPSAIRIRDGWDRHIEAERLAAAVMDANSDALRRGMKAWSDQLDATRWWSERARADADEPPTVHADPPPLPAGAAREPGELTEDVLRALHTVRQSPPAAPSSWEGTDPQRHVALTFGSRGLISCSIDPAWAARQAGEAITTALGQALRTAKAAMPAKPAIGADADQLLGDTLATLRALTGQPLAEGETR